MDRRDLDDYGLNELNELNEFKIPTDHQGQSKQSVNSNVALLHPLPDSAASCPKSSPRTS